MSSDSTCTYTALVQSDKSDQFATVDWISLEEQVNIDLSLEEEGKFFHLQLECVVIVGQLNVYSAKVV